MLKGLALSLDGAPNSEDLYSIKARGADCVRFEAFPGMTSGLVPFLHQTGLHLVLLLSRNLCPQYTNAEWNSTGEEFQGVMNTWQQAVKTLMATVSEHAVVDYVEIWNEPNGNIGSPNDTGLHPWNFAHLYRAAHDVLVTNHPQTKIISGGVFAHANSGALYLKEARAVFPLHWDYTGLHPYIDIAQSFQPAVLQNFVEELHSILPVPCFVTEAGWQTSVVSQELQAANIHSLMDTARQNAVQGVLIFTLHDVPSMNLYYGIYDKTAWWAFPTY